MEGNVEKAVTLAALVDHYLHTESHTLMEPDGVALNYLLTTGNRNLGKELFERTLMGVRTLRMEDVVTQELSSAG
jgi:hypothetical protein